MQWRSCDLPFSLIPHTLELMATYLVCILIALAIHRIWNYEDIFAFPRAWVTRLKFLSCPACNAFWVSVPVAAVAAVLGEMRVVEALVFPLVAYTPIRLAVWVYEQSWSSLFQQRPGVARPTSAPVDVRPPVASNVKAATPGSGCKTCDEKKKAIQSERARTDSYKQRVVLLTPATDVVEGEDIHRLATMLAADTSRLVQIWVRPHSDGSAPSVAPLPTNVDVRAVVPAADATGQPVIAALVDKLIWLGNAKIVTVGVLGSDTSLTEAITGELGRVRAFAWLHLKVSAVSPLPYHVIRPLLPDSSAQLEEWLSVAQPIPAP